MANDLPDVLRAGPLVFVDSIEAPVLADGDLHHLRRSLRLVDGDALCVADGRGNWRSATLLGETLGDLGETSVDAAPNPVLTVGLAMPKGARLDVAVAKLTEIGIDAVVLVAARRSVVRWPPAEVDRRLARLRRVSREAAMQSRRPRLPEITGVHTVAELVEASGRRVAMAEPGGRPIGQDHHVVLIGPEGGWAPEELALGAEAVSLGPTVLRVETAAIAAGVALCGRRSGWLP